jgi:hypothetical protein
MTGFLVVGIAVFGPAPKTRFSQPKTNYWPPKHRNINNDRFFGCGNSCFRTRPQNTIQPAERPTGRQSTETSIMRSFLFGGIPVFGPAIKTRFSQPKDQLAANALKHQ